MDSIDGVLPASLREKKDIILPPSNELEFLRYLERDFSVQRIDDVYNHLWLVCKPYPARSLSTQKVLDREIIPTNDTSLHLVWTTKKMYIKPLPRLLLFPSFFDQYLSPAKQQVYSEARPALGLLYSYIALLPTELDFDLAKKVNLLHDDCKWDDWRKLVRRLLEDYPDISSHVPKRYEYGELRLDRLDKIYRYLRGSWLHGYSPLTGSTRYVDFFGKNIAIIGTSTVYLVVIVSAMSLGRTTKTLKDNEAFERACYGFTVFAIFLPLLAIGLIVFVFFFMFIGNYLNTLAVQRGPRTKSEKHSAIDSNGVEMDAVVLNRRTEEQV